MEYRPTQLALLDPEHLLIEWNDGEKSICPVHTLRQRCPCATCRERRNEKPRDPLALDVLKPEEAQPIRILEMNPVGNYAYGIAFSDGHDTGIFTLELLRKLGTEVEA